MARSIQKENRWVRTSLQSIANIWIRFPQEHTLIGSDNSQDIQLCGMGILPEHCIIDITPEGQVMLTPQKNTR